MAVFGIAFVIIGFNITYNCIFTFNHLARQYLYVIILKTFCSDGLYRCMLCVA